MLNIKNHLIGNEDFEGFRSELQFEAKQLNVSAEYMQTLLNLLVDIIKKDEVSVYVQNPILQKRFICFISKLHQEVKYINADDDELIGIITSFINEVISVVNHTLVSIDNTALFLKVDKYRLTHINSVRSYDLLEQFKFADNSEKKLQEIFHLHYPYLINKLMNKVFVFDSNRAIENKLEGIFEHFANANNARVFKYLCKECGVDENETFITATKLEENEQVLQSHELIGAMLIYRFAKNYLEFIK